MKRRDTKEVALTGFCGLDWEGQRSQSPFSGSVPHVGSAPARRWGRRGEEEVGWTAGKRWRAEALFVELRFDVLVSCPRGSVC